MVLLTQTQEPRTFAGFLPSEDLIHDLFKFRLTLTAATYD
jgi:hypothetical protein